ncbi:uncharacterized protein [Onthophagus taurus]|uniref:uncharacterized protein n=1 Tax=Onthophagus taurus TaxID=166361 RepID=UPI0039BE86D3
MAAFYALEVRIYIPAPMRCFNCQRFGHTSLHCEAEQICVCGKAAHEGQPCESPLVCVNCGGPHSARSRVCPVYKKEVAIQEIKTKERLTYAEAKRKVQAMQRTPVSGVSYSAVASTQPKYDSLVKDLIPAIVAAIKPLIQRTSSPSPFVKPATPIFKTPQIMNLTVENVERASQANLFHFESGSDKRKREGNQTSSTTKCRSSPLTQKRIAQEKESLAER